MANRRALSVQIALRVGSTEHKRLKAAARNEQRTVSDYVRLAINEKIARDEAEEEDEGE